jgi:hypothetical protein
MYTTYRSLRENHIHSKHNINFFLLLNMMAHQSNSSPCKTDAHFTAMKPNYNSTPLFMYNELLPLAYYRI